LGVALTTIFRGTTAAIIVFRGHLNDSKIQPVGCYLFAFLVLRWLFPDRTKNETMSNTNNHPPHTAMQPLLAIRGRDASIHVSKKSFLVFKHNRYLTVSTENIALFHIQNDLPVIMCFDRQEYFVNYSLEQIQQLLSGSQFYRLNRQYLVNFNAIKEVEHYFARKLLVKLSIAFSEKLIVSKEKATSFLGWLENR
jgi:DNA-binding LytR/AlgR family response regulator